MSTRSAVLLALAAAAPAQLDRGAAARGLEGVPLRAQGSTLTPGHAGRPGRHAPEPRSACPCRREHRVRRTRDRAKRAGDPVHGYLPRINCGHCAAQDTCGLLCRADKHVMLAI